MSRSIYVFMQTFVNEHNLQLNYFPDNNFLKNPFLLACVQVFTNKIFITSVALGVYQVKLIINL